MNHSDKKDSYSLTFPDAETVEENSTENTMESSVEFPVKPSREEMERKSRLLSRLFKHQDLMTPPKSSPRINKKKLTNIINHINFTNGYLWVHLKDPRYGEDIFTRAYPQPCMGETITCQWSKESTTGFEHYRFLNLLIDDGMSAVVVPVKFLNISGDRFTIHMPDTGYILGKRKARYACHEVTAELSQSGFLAKGELLDFSAFSFHIRVTPAFNGSFHWLNPDEPLIVNLYRDQRIIFSGSCRFIHQTGNMSGKEIVVAPLVEQFNRFKSRKIRSPRMQLAPSSSISFEHPLSRKRVQRDIHDISVTGFSVHERDNESVLIPGTIISELNINYSGAMTMPCTAQVLYRKKKKKGLFQCGLVILDMDVTTYGRLSNILGNMTDANVHVCDEIGMDALWEFFFETGFIYPKKYNLIEPHKDDFKETYRKLYQDKPEIASHMTYQKNGQIYGHVSMIKAYERSWMVHHLAARSVPGTRNHTGVPLLRQIIHYFEGFYRLPAFKMDHWLCYYRPQTKFMDLFFGDFARHFRNPRGCSLDLFAYKSYPTASPQRQFPDGWLLREFLTSDLFELERFYRNSSNGLLLDVLRLGEGASGGESLEELYKRYGFTRKCKAYSLTYMRELNAVFIVNQSDLGLNLSELLNSIKIIITNSASLPWDVLSSAVARLTEVYDVEKIPLLIYPHTYLENEDISYEKQYIMFIMDMQYGKDFLDYMKGRLKAKIRFLIRFLIKRYLAK
ncbi:MAG: hypothetical protein JRC60_04705 [Deltaproteobacteria bacterium]|nr:hypothetical protein [Deltaproteobacteria bacterium]